jgi:hypothetical protein
MATRTEGVRGAADAVVAHGDMKRKETAMHRGGGSKT